MMCRVVLSCVVDVARQCHCERIVARTHSADSRRADTSTDPPDRCVRALRHHSAGKGSAFDGGPMEACLRSACPCLEVLWTRLFGEKRDPPAEGGGGARTSPDQSSVYQALWEFDSRLPGELSFRPGDLFTVPSRSGHWWEAQRVDNSGRVLDTGLVPANYMALAGSLESQT